MCRKDGVEVCRALMNRMVFMRFYLFKTVGKAIYYFLVRVYKLGV